MVHAQAGDAVFNVCNYCEIKEGVYEATDMSVRTVGRINQERNSVLNSDKKVTSPGKKQRAVLEVCRTIK